MSTTQNSKTRDGILAAALVALAEHIADHHLPAPGSIDFPLDEDSIFVRVSVQGVGKQAAWLDSVVVKHEVNLPSVTGPSYVSTTWDVALPDTLTRIRLRGERPAGLAAVTA